MLCVSEGSNGKCSSWWGVCIEFSYMRNGNEWAGNVTPDCCKKGSLQALRIGTHFVPDPYGFHLGENMSLWDYSKIKREEEEATSERQHFGAAEGRGTDSHRERMTAPAQTPTLPTLDPCLHPVIAAEPVADERVLAVTEPQQCLLNEVETSQEHLTLQPQQLHKVVYLVFSIRDSFSTGICSSCTIALSSETAAVSRVFDRT
ncbi:hypothetical protein F7725_019123 [Dissostichus mawsoni]|uniref:Uncharacterized protein n=1 Tax=Dissostichus mawsoni TaxID=36200 RepID=A0A7J5XTG4_DISMA|nr:hypothetical protein F7725_019123 [Dissostichus mawsoni]